MFLLMTASNDIPWFFSHVFPWPFVVVGGAWVFDAIRAMMLAHQSHHWPTTEAVVVTSHAKTTDDGDDVPFLSYSHIFEYRYSANGEARRGSKIALADSIGGKQQVEAVVKKYAVGRCVRVYFSAHHVELAVLEPGLCWPHFRALLAGLAFLGAGVVMLRVLNPHQL